MYLLIRRVNPQSTVVLRYDHILRTLLWAKNRDGGNKEMVLLQTGRRSSFGSPVGGMPILYTSLKRPKWYRVADGKGYYIFLGGNSSSSLRLFPRKI